MDGFEIKPIKKVSVESVTDFGSVKLKVAEMMKKYGVSIKEMHESTDSSLNTIKRYERAENIQQIDITLLAQMCYLFDCQISDLLEYVPPENTEQ